MNFENHSDEEVNYGTSFLNEAFSIMQVQKEASGKNGRSQMQGTSQRAEPTNLRKPQKSSNNSNVQKLSGKQQQQQQTQKPKANISDHNKNIDDNHNNNGKCTNNTDQNSQVSNFSNASRQSRNSNSRRAGTRAVGARNNRFGGQNKFAKFMREHQTVLTGKFVTHTMMPNSGVISGGKFTITNADDVELFFQLYAAEIHSKRQVAMIERHLEFGGPIVYDLDFRYTSEAITELSEMSEEELNDEEARYYRIYDATFVRTFIHQAYVIISHYVNVENIPAAREVYVTEKTKAKRGNNGMWKDGLHFIFPNIIVSPDVQYMIREELVESMRDEFDGLGLENSAEDIIDDCVIDKNGWMMYGSYKMDSEPYLVQPDENSVSGLYYADTSEANIRVASGPEFARPGGTEYSINKLIRKLSVRNATLTDIADLTDSGQSHLTKWLDSQTTKIRKHIEERTGASTVNLLNSRESLHFVSGLVDLLSKERASSRDSWIKVGWCLFNIDYRLLDKWIEFSKRDENYADGAEEACTQAWETMEKKNMTVASLISWAKEDNPEETRHYLTRESLTGKVRNVLGALVSGFKKVDAKAPAGRGNANAITQIRSVQYTPIFRDFAECLFSITRLMQHCYGDEFVWSGDHWYQFVHHGWKKLMTRCDHPEILKTRLVEEDGIYGIFEEEAARLETLVRKLQSSTNTSSGDSSDAEKLWKVQGYLTACKEITKKIRLQKNQNGVMAEASRMFHWEKKYNAENSGFATSKKQSSMLTSNGLQTQHNRKKSGQNASATTATTVTTGSDTNASRSCMSLNSSYAIDSIFGDTDDKCPTFFEDVLDKKIYLLRFSNGVFDLKLNLFRNGQPEDFLTMSTHIDYYDYYTWNHEDVKATMKFLCEIQPNEENRNYVLQVLASFLDGHNGQERFHVFYGRGANGKSKLIEFFSNAMGDYATNLPVTLLTGKRAQSSGPTPELAKMKGKRFAVMNEPGSGDQMNMGLLKEITGGDKVYARALHSNPIEFKFEAGIVLLCNDKPRVDPMDEATWRRIRALYFPSKFMDDPDLSIRDNQGHQIQYKRDYHLDEKLKKLRNAFMWILVQYYRANQEGNPFFQWTSTYVTDESGNRVLKTGLGPGIYEPDSVTEFTKAYRSENDPIQHFIERVVRNRTGGFIELSVMYELYKHSCYTKNIPKIPQQKFKEYFEVTKNWGPVSTQDSRQGWKNREIPFNLAETAPEFKSYLERPENMNLLTPPV